MAGEHSRWLVYSKMRGRAQEHPAGLRWGSHRWNTAEECYDRDEQECSILWGMEIFLLIFAVFFGGLGETMAAFQRLLGVLSGAARRLRRTLLSSRRSSPAPLPPDQSPDR